MTPQCAGGDLFKAEARVNSKGLAASSIRPSQGGAARRRSVLMHPAVFVAAFTLLGILFAVQEWANVRRAGYHIDARIVFESWGLQYFLWGITAWVLWRFFRSFIQNASVLRMSDHRFPGKSRNLPDRGDDLGQSFSRTFRMDHRPMPYWQRVDSTSKAIW